MRILILGSDNFAEPLRRLGHEVWCAGPDPASDLPCPQQDVDWRDLERMLEQYGLCVEAVLVTDNVGRRQLPTGLWAAPLVTAFYGVDSPLNRFWQFPYGRLFDLVFLDQRGEALALAEEHPAVHWLPVGVDAARYAGAPEAPLRPGVCFVGVVEDSVRPKRSALLAKVAKWAPLEVRGGRQGQWCTTEEAAGLYRRYQVVLNENLFPGVTTRPLEVMAAGGCLLSEAAPGHMDEFFKDGEHLLYFTADDLKYKLEYCLRENGAGGKLAARGRETVLAGHTLDHRAAEVAGRLEQMVDIPIAERARAGSGQAMHCEGEALLMAAARWPREAGTRLARAAGRLKAAANDATTAATLLSAGQASLLLGQIEPGLELLRQAGSQDAPLAELTLALGYLSSGMTEQCRRALVDLDGRAPGIALGPGTAEFHLAAARLLADEGRPLLPGFALGGLPLSWWSALEHALAAGQRDAGCAEAWELAGDILDGAHAPCEAAQCYARAAAGHGGPEVSAKLADARHRGYLD